MRYLLLFSLFILSLPAAAQVMDTVYTYYPNGNLKAKRIVRNEELEQEFVYLENGSRKHQWDLDKKEVYSYHAFGDPGDSSAIYFIERSPSYTIYQYYGDSPDLFYVERYRHHIRHGQAQYFHRNGQLKAEGRFEDWKKVGFWTYGDESGRRDIQWHMLNQGFYEAGLSVFYTIFPFLLTVLFLVITGVYLTRKGLYPVFYNLVAVLPFALFAFGLIVAVRGEGFFVILGTATAALVLLSLVNVVWAGRLRVRRYKSLLLFFAGLCFGTFLIWLKVISAIAGAIVM